jgi:5-methylcytosine-specific restriction endonuclease McrA
MPPVYPEPSKQCSTCGETKPLTEYFKKNGAKDGLRGYCKTCSAAYRRKWMRENPERGQALRARTYTKHRDKRVAHHREYNNQNRERINAESRRRAQENPELIRARGAAYKAANPAKYSEYEARRRWRKANLAVGEVDYDAILERDGLVCHICGQPVPQGEHQFDHVIPLAKGGEHSAENIKIAHGLCNRKKGAS